MAGNEAARAAAVAALQRLAASPPKPMEGKHPMAAGFLRYFKHLKEVQYAGGNELGEFYSGNAVRVTQNTPRHVVPFTGAKNTLGVSDAPPPADDTGLSPPLRRRRKTAPPPAHETAPPPPAHETAPPAPNGKGKELETTPPPQGEEKERPEGYNKWGPKPKAYEGKGKEREETPEMLDPDVLATSLEEHDCEQQVAAEVFATSVAVDRQQKVDPEVFATLVALEMENMSN